MNDNPKSSLDRAMALLRTTAEYEQYLSIKITPIPQECCCFHCWPMTWAEINQWIAPAGPLKDEGGVLIQREEATFVLRCHESGPELVIPLVMTAATIPLKCIELVLDLVITLLKARQKERTQPSGTVRMTTRRLTKGDVHAEHTTEITFPLSRDVVQKLNEDVMRAIEEGRSDAASQ